MRTKQVIVLAFLLVVMAGCGPKAGGVEQSTDYERIARETTRSGVSRFIDKEAGVVCWVYAGYSKGGISCLPISQTQLDP